MKKLFSTFLAVLMYATLALCQTAAVDLTLTVADNAGGSRVLRFGLDLTATTGIDPHLGESDLPPFPPLGAYEARWNLQPFGVGVLSTYQDYRNAPSFPFTGQIIHRINWQYSDLATQISFTYNLPPEATMLITSNNATPLWSSGTLTGSGTYVVPDPDNEYSAARVFVNYDAILPVELTSFTSSVIGTAVKLNWSTASEINNKGFEVERRVANQTEWQNIGFVQGAGTSSSANEYSYTDKPGTGKFQYRLRQIDFDGTFAYSQIVDAEVSLPTEFILNQNYPNPFNPSTKISYSLPVEGNVKLSVFNSIGQEMTILVSEYQAAGIYEVLWTADNFTSGVYFYQLEVTGSDGVLAAKEMKKSILIK